LADFTRLRDYFQDKRKVRILILDNNNIQYCNQHEQYFPVDYIFSDYDLVLVPGWIHAEVSQSERGLEYLSRAPRELMVFLEEEDYLPLIQYEDERLIKLFKMATAIYPTCKQFFKSLQAEIGRTGDIPDDWIESFYDSGFDVTTTSDGKQLKKNAGEVSILTLSFLLVHYFGDKINYITICSNDMASYQIKRAILDYVGKERLLTLSRIPIGFKTTDVILIEAFKKGLIGPSQVSQLRTNSRSCIYVRRLPDGTSETFEHVVSTVDFIDILSDIGNYDFIF